MSGMRMPNLPVSALNVAKSGLQTPQDQQTVGGTNDFKGGLITDEDPTQIPFNALVTAQNVAYIRNMLFRRNGLQLYSNPKPNSLKILNLFAYRDISLGFNIFRFGSGHIHKATSTGWLEFLNAAGTSALAGSDTDYFRFAVGDNRAFFSNNGIDPIREIDLTNHQYKVLGDAPRYRYITMAANRLIGANFNEAAAAPYQFGWSGNLNYGEWNPLTDLSAGNTPLVDSPTDLDDDITGLLSTDNYVVFPRKKSIWLASIQASATAPFYCYPVVPRIGADTPRTIIMTEYGMVWYNYANSSVYVWDPSQFYAKTLPQDILGPIRRYVKQLIDTPSNVWASYNSEFKAYSLFIASNTQTQVHAITFSFVTKTWSEEIYDSGVSAITDLDYASSTVSINELTGTINTLVGTINSLGGIVSSGGRFVGYINGDLATQPVYAAYPSEVGNIVTTDNGVAFTSTIDSKIVEIDPDDLAISLVRAGLTPYSTGTISLYQSKDDGNTWTLLKNLVVDSTMLKKNHLIQVKKAIVGRRLQWRIQTSDCMFALTSFKVKAMPAGMAQQTTP